MVDLKEVVVCVVEAKEAVDGLLVAPSLVGVVVQQLLQEVALLVLVVSPEAVVVAMLAPGVPVLQAPVVEQPKAFGCS